MSEIKNAFNNLSENIAFGRINSAASGKKVASETIARIGADTKKQEPISTASKTPEQLQQLFQNNKRKLLKEVKRLPKGGQKRLPTSGRKKTGKCINEKTPAEQKEEALKLRKLKTSYRNAVKYLKKFEEHDLETLTDREKSLLRSCLRRKQRIDEEQGLPVASTRFDYLLTEAEEANESKEDSETVKENSETKDKTIEQKETQEPISTANKTPEQLQQLFQNNKRKLLKEVKRLPKGGQKRLPTSGRKRLVLLKENVGIDVLEGRILARLPKKRLEILFTFSAEYKKRTGKCINEKTPVEQKMEEQKEEALKLRKSRNSYRNAVKYLMKFAEHDLETLTGREKALLRICLRRKQRTDEEQGLPVATTRFDYLLTEAEEASESKEDSETVKENAETKDKTIEHKEKTDATTTNENQDEKKEDAIEDLTNEPEDQVENEEQNFEDNEEITEEQTDREENA